MHVQEAIIEAHTDNIQSQHVQWLYHAKVEQSSITQQDMLVYTNPIDTMKQHIQYTPSIASLNGFTLNVLAFCTHAGCML